MHSNYTAFSLCINYTAFSLLINAYVIVVDNFSTNPRMTLKVSVSNGRYQPVQDESSANNYIYTMLYHAQ